MSVQYIVNLFVHLLNKMTAVCKQRTGVWGGETLERSTFCIQILRCILWNVLQCLVTDTRLTEIIVC